MFRFFYIEDLTRYPWQLTCANFMELHRSLQWNHRFLRLKTSI
ncbi:hypothetical protein HanXRQr2_Chr09g0396711 [Helianthus annuus]|uniref:Uncharacterized protein n=1 Tax=Helianthus annuus TaxID=4232 RepID=A0A9K3I7D4_HELAN|nr:hypothetical protein HanXRQr2_Chr09g0396711 [Helianthus annuus]KAJ0893855.1 hypothetical protein HanPSC8_Chr09g0382481 [Helianthus annuus]